MALELGGGTENNNNSIPFVGTWNRTEPETGIMRTYIFNPDYTHKMIVINPNDDGQTNVKLTWTGTYEYNDSQITRNITKATASADNVAEYEIPPENLSYRPLNWSLQGNILILDDEEYRK